MASTTSTSKPKSVHFLAFVHGMWGSPKHLESVEKEIQKKFADKEEGIIELATLRVQTNAESFTYDGLDWGAERAVKEIYETIEALEKDGLKRVTRFSIVGYSLGGLISRYTIGILYQRGFFRTVEPVNFTTFATPHIGLPRFRGFVGRMMHTLGPIMLSRTGRQFYSTDNDIWSPGAQEGRPLLEVMSDQDTIFFKALVAFPNVSIYGNAVHDLTVTYCSSMIESHDPFTVLGSKSHRLAIKLDPKYRHVIQSFREVPEGEEVPLNELEEEQKAKKAAIPWYKPARYGGDRQGLPPMLQFPFPLNLLFYMLTPFLIPLALTYAAVRFRRESRSSRRRLEMLNASPEAESTLSSILRRMEMAVAEVVDPSNPGINTRRASGEWEGDLEEGGALGTSKDEGGDEMRNRKASRPDTPEHGAGADSLPTPIHTPVPGSSPTPDPLAKQENNNSRSKPASSKKDDRLQPVLTPSQLGMIASLNSIPQLRKYRAYFPYVRNAHSVIIARDVKQFPVHEDGLPVLRHWADRFVF